MSGWAWAALAVIVTVDVGLLAWLLREVHADRRVAELEEILGLRDGTRESEHRAASEARS